MSMESPHARNPIRLTTSGPLNSQAYSKTVYKNPIVTIMKDCGSLSEIKDYLLAVFCKDIDTNHRNEYTEPIDSNNCFDIH